MAEMEHQRFVQERLQQGWRYGPVKDLANKIGPALVSWQKLPEEEREKDRNSVRNLTAFLAAAGFRVYRFTKGV
jgi:hypothetical protein